MKKGGLGLHSLRKVAVRYTAVIKERWVIYGGGMGGWVCGKDRINNDLSRKSRQWRVCLCVSVCWGVGMGVGMGGKFPV